ncbi:MAG: response regulator, partial [Candidatus Aminicenantales bacterium]
DEQQVMRLGKKTLESLGYKVTASSNPSRAFQIFKAHPENFDLVIADLFMPRIDGSRLSSEILKIRPDIPVILCTVNGRQMAKEKAEEMGIQGFIYKPFLKKDVALTVRKVLDQAKTRRS